MLSANKIGLLRLASMKLLGGVCIACGEYDLTSLHIHHVDPLKTPSGRGQAVRAWEGLNIAVCEKALLLCPYCHGLFHSDDKMIWLQRQPSIEYLTDRRRAFIEEMKSLYEDDVEIFRCSAA